MCLHWKTTLSIKNHWMDKEIPWSWGCTRNCLLGEGSLLLQYFTYGLSLVISTIFWQQKVPAAPKKVSGQGFYCVFRKKIHAVHDSFCCWREVMGNSYNLEAPTWIHTYQRAVRSHRKNPWPIEQVPMQRGEDSAAVDEEHSYWKLTMAIHREDSQKTRSERYVLPLGISPLGIYPLLSTYSRSHCHNFPVARDMYMYTYFRFKISPGWIDTLHGLQSFNWLLLIITQNDGWKRNLSLVNIKLF